MCYILHSDWSLLNIQGSLHSKQGGDITITYTPARGVQNTGSNMQDTQQH